MIGTRKSSERGHVDHGWLQARHTFSFGSYHDPEFVQFRTLRVMNEDRVAPGAGFGLHPHRDMEIVTLVLSGALEHRDSLGNGSVIRPDDVQRMTAGTGIRHSEMNHSPAEPVHLYQIWILPERPGLEPGYEEISHHVSEREDRLQLIASPEGKDGAVKIHQDARLFRARLLGEKTVAHELQPGRHAWLQVLEGDVNLGDVSLSTGDGAYLSEEPGLEVGSRGTAEILLFDLS